MDVQRPSGTFSGVQGGFLESKCDGCVCFMPLYACLSNVPVLNARAWDIPSYVCCPCM